ncbi:MAG: enoyl-CoA hydratase/isomerase family protein [Variibacter sp.]
MSNVQDIEVAVDDHGIAVVTLNRPQKRNAVSLGMWRGLAATFSGLGGRADVRTVILTGAGGNFCAGADISEFPKVRFDAESGRVYEEAGEAASFAIRDCRKPTIAAISGYAIGGGCGLALCCDFRVADCTARMGITAAKLGIVYGTLDCDLLYRQVGLANAKRVLFTGRHFPLDECLAMGLVDIAAPETAIENAHAFAAEIAGNAPLSVAGSKLILEAIAAGAAERRKSEIAEAIDRAMDSADYREGARAFIDKRRPNFTGR